MRKTYKPQAKPYMVGNRYRPITLKGWKYEYDLEKRRRFYKKVVQAVDAIDMYQLKIQRAVENTKLIDNYKGITNVPITK